MCREDLRSSAKRGGVNNYDLFTSNHTLNVNVQPIPDTVHLHLPIHSRSTANRSTTIVWNCNKLNWSGPAQGDWVGPPPYVAGPNIDCIADIKKWPIPSTSWALETPCSSSFSLPLSPYSFFIILTSCPSLWDQVLDGSLSGRGNTWYKLKPDTDHECL